MNKMCLVSNIASISGLKKIDAEKAVDAFIEAVTKELSMEEEVKLSGFGAFSVVKRAASKGRNIKTGESISIPARIVPKFKPGKRLKEIVLGKID